MDENDVTRLEILKLVISNMDESFDETPRRILSACELYYRWVSATADQTTATD